jgi:hypothetical protein
LYIWFWWGNLRECDHVGDTGVGGRIILRLSFRKWYERAIYWTELAKDRERWRELECDNEPSGFIKCGEFLD